MPNLSPSSQCPHSRQPLHINWSAECPVVWNIPLASLGQLSWFCPLTAPAASPAWPLAGEHEKLKSCWLSVSTALQQLKYWCVITITFITNPKQSTITATMKKAGYQPKPGHLCILKMNMGLNFLFVCSHR